MHQIKKPVVTVGVDFFKLRTNDREVDRQDNLCDPLFSECGQPVACSPLIEKGFQPEPAIPFDNVYVPIWYRKEVNINRDASFQPEIINFGGGKNLLTRLAMRGNEGFKTPVRFRRLITFQIGADNSCGNSQTNQ